MANLSIILNILTGLFEQLLFSSTQIGMLHLIEQMKIDGYFCPDRNITISSFSTQNVNHKTCQDQRAQNNYASTILAVGTILGISSFLAGILLDQFSVIIIRVLSFLSLSFSFILLSLVNYGTEYIMYISQTLLGFGCLLNTLQNLRDIPKLSASSSHEIVLRSICGGLASTSQAIVWLFCKGLRYFKVENNIHKWFSLIWLVILIFLHLPRTVVLLVKQISDRNQQSSDADEEQVNFNYRNDSIQNDSSSDDGRCVENKTNTVSTEITLNSDESALSVDSRSTSLSQESAQHGEIMSTQTRQSVYSIISSYFQNINQEILTKKFLFQALYLCFGTFPYYCWVSWIPQWMGPDGKNYDLRTQKEILDKLGYIQLSMALFSPMPGLLISVFGKILKCFRNPRSSIPLEGHKLGSVIFFLTIFGQIAALSAIIIVQPYQLNYLTIILLSLQNQNVFSFNNSLVVHMFPVHFVGRIIGLSRTFQGLFTLIILGVYKIFPWVTVNDFLGVSFVCMPLLLILGCYVYGRAGRDIASRASS